MIEKGQIYSLQNSIKIRTGEVISESLVNNDVVDVSLFGFYEGENISLEAAAFERIYLPIENKLQMLVEGAQYEVEPYDFTVIEQGKNRDIFGVGNYKLLMITIKENIMLKNIEKQKLLNLETEIEYQSNKIASKTLANNEKLSMTLLAFDGKQELSTHSAPGDALVIALDGEALINIDGKDFTVKKGESLIMPAKIPHAVYVKEKYKMLLIVSK